MAAAVVPLVTPSAEVTPKGDRFITNAWYTLKRDSAVPVSLRRCPVRAVTITFFQLLSTSHCEDIHENITRGEAIASPSASLLPSPCTGKWPDRHGSTGYSIPAAVIFLCAGRSQNAEATASIRS